MKSRQHVLKPIVKKKKKKRENELINEQGEKRHRRLINREYFAYVTRLQVRPARVLRADLGFEVFSAAAHGCIVPRGRTRIPAARKKAAVALRVAPPCLQRAS